MSLPNRRAVIDDSDIRIRYDGAGWVQDISGGQDGTGTYGATYNHTLHTTKANGSLAFSFEGTSIQVYGTVNLSPTYNASIVSDPSFQPPWECFIDNISIGASKPSPFQENNWVFCENDHLNDGSHELKLNINMKQGTTFWLDYLQYTPSQTPENGLVVLVDNSDPSLSYDSTWQGVESTATMTTTQGGKVTFNFNGTQLTWIGVIPIDYPGNGSSASYSVDNGTPTSFDLVGHPATDGTSRYNQIFFTTPKLSPGSHNLSVTYNGNSQLTPLTLDYIYLTTSTSTSSSGPATTSPSSSSTSGHHTNVGAIAGGVVGGIAAIAILIRFVFWWQRRSQRPVSSAPFTSGSSWMGGQPGSAASPQPISMPSPNSVQPFQFQASSAGLSSESLTRTGSYSITSGATSPLSLHSGRYISGAMAQAGDIKRDVRGVHAIQPQASFSTTTSHPNLAGGHPDEIQPPQYYA